MRSVKNIQKITKAMKMVAASKLRAIQTRAENSRGLWQPFTALLGDTPSKFINNSDYVSVLLWFYYLMPLLPQALSILYSTFIIFNYSFSTSEILVFLLLPLL